MKVSYLLSFDNKLKCFLDHSRGQRITLVEIRSAVDKDPMLGDDITEERKEELLVELKEYREVNTKGARVDNRAVNHDYQHTVSQMNQEVSWHKA